MARKLVEIREATRSDAEAISRVHDEAWRGTYQGIIPHLHLERMITRRSPAWWAQSLGRTRSGVLVLTFNKIVQGYTSYGAARIPRRSKTGEIYELYLAPTFQGLGLGKMLFTAARQALTRRGSRSLLVWALADNEAACSFYARLGGQRCATSAETYGDVSLSRIAFLWESVDRPTR